LAAGYSTCFELRGLNIIRRAIYRLHASDRNITSVLSGIPPAIRYGRHANCLTRVALRFPADRHHLVPKGTMVRLPITQRSAQRFVRLQPGVYPLSLVKPLKFAHLCRVPLYVPIKLGRVLMHPTEGAVTKPASLNLKRFRAEAARVRRSVCSGIRMLISITAAPTAASAASSCPSTRSSTATPSTTTATTAIGIGVSCESRRYRSRHQRSY
jgi:hypothetical protein